VLDGKFSILEALGEGGTGRVYRARQVGLDRLVCVKILRASVATDATSARRFEREAKSASRVRHPNSIQVFDIGVLPGDGRAYIAMELVEGSNLAHVIFREWPLSEARTCHIMAQVCDALGAAHAVQVIHRDLKPENIMLERVGADPDFVKVLDFGLAKIAMPGLPSVTGEGVVCGTPEYISPEQATAAPVDHRADLYSVGAILYHMVTGRLPFDGSSPADFLRKHAREMPRAIRVRRPEAMVSPALESLITRLLDKDPARRPQSADEVSYDLRLIGEAAQPGRRTPISRAPAVPPTQPSMAPRLPTPPPAARVPEPTLPPPRIVSRPKMPAMMPAPLAPALDPGATEKSIGKLDGISLLMKPAPEPTPGRGPIGRDPAWTTPGLGPSSVAPPDPNSLPPRFPQTVELLLSALGRALISPIASSARAALPKGLLDPRIRALAERRDFDSIAAACHERAESLAALGDEELALTGKAAASRSDYGTAVIAFMRVGVDHPDSAFAPGALLRAERLLSEQLHMRTQGARVLAHLLRRYPKSEAAAEANAPRR
jgi:serine/threonine-protein kinase